MDRKDLITLAENVADGIQPGEVDCRSPLRPPAVPENYRHVALCVS